MVFSLLTRKQQVRTNVAIVYQRTLKGVNYEVRSAGLTRRLYTNGAFHTQYHPGRTFTYGIWDLLTIPALYAPSTLSRVCCDGTPAQSALVLGVGGGTAIHQSHDLLAIRRTIGVELDPQHLYLARRFFGLGKRSELTLIEADAISWLIKNRRRHALVIDDLYLHNPRKYSGHVPRKSPGKSPGHSPVSSPGSQDSERDPVRPSLPEPQRWMKTLAGRVSRRGVLVQNHLDASLARKAVTESRSSLELHFRSALLFTTPQYTNGILALYRETVSARQMSKPVRDYVRTFGKPPRFACQQLF